MRCSHIVVVLVVAGGVALAAQGATFGLGRPVPAGELPPPYTAVSPDGTGLPAGEGTAVEGAEVYAARGCARCHGATGAEGPSSRLVGPPGTMAGIAAHAFAPLVWSYINTMMPRDLQEQRVALTVTPRLGRAGRPPRCCLGADEVYSLTAYLLYKNGIIAEDNVMNATTLPQVQMPNRDGYVPRPSRSGHPASGTSEGPLPRCDQSRPSSAAAQSAPVACSARRARRGGGYTAPGLGTSGKGEPRMTRSGQTARRLLAAGFGVAAVLLAGMPALAQGGGQTAHAGRRPESTRPPLSTGRSTT